LLPVRGPRTPSVRPAVAGGVALVLSMLAAPAARAEIPSTEVLDQLSERLLAKPDCAPTCASSSRMLLDVHGNVLRARVSIEASETTAVPLPGGAAQWLPERVLLDGAE